MEVDVAGYSGWKIDGFELPAPDSDASISKNDLDAEGSGRDEQGYMHRIVLRHKVKKWGFKYAVLKESDYNYIEELFDGKSDFSFSYFKDGEEKMTTKAYCSGISALIHNISNGIYKGVSFNIIEV
jgi:hypothetical protein